MDRIYDKYDLRARLSVAILIIAPIVLDLSFCLKSQEGNIATVVIALIAIALSCCGIAAVRYYSNTSKRIKNRKNLAAIMLLPTDSTFSDVTKQRYLDKLTNINPALSPFVEGINRTDGYENSCSVISWILENTRDSRAYPILAEDQIGYGFAKNMYTVKPFALVVFILESIAAIGIVIWKAEGECLMNRISYAWELYASEIIASVAIHLVVLFVWLFIARKKFYYNAEERLAKAILQSIDGMKQQSAVNIEDATE